jgi:hypothetical protein
VFRNFMSLSTFFHGVNLASEKERTNYLIRRAVMPWLGKRFRAADLATLTH